MVKEGKMTAIYLRLSLEDARREEKISERDRESNSISNQRKLLLDYISQDQELKKQRIEEFCDDGFSGTNMDRPGMQEMLKMVRQGKIGCILVKDLSRFARNYIELGDYLNQIFPFMGVRFISLNDHYDSGRQEGNIPAIDIAFQTLVYDLYSKDLSVKIKSAFQNKCERGEFVFGQVPLGYVKSKTEKNKVLVHEKEAEVVRHIFALAETGMSSTQIAKKLIAEKIPTTTQMRHPERKIAKENHAWSPGAVRGILNNRFYLGEMAYGKHTRKAVGSRNVIPLPKETWKVIQNHHEPLIPKEVYEKVSSFRPEQSTKRKREKHPLTGKIYCGGCGYAVVYSPQKKKSKIAPHFWCTKHSVLQIPDCCTCFRADILEEIVLAELYKELMHRGDLLNQSESLQNFQKKELKRWELVLKDCREKYRGLSSKRNALYERYAEKLIGPESYRSYVDKIDLQMQEISTTMKEAEEAVGRIKEEYAQPRMDMKEIIRFSKMEKLTQEMVDIFIKRVTVYRDKRVEIEWNYTWGENL